MQPDGMLLAAFLRGKDGLIPKSNESHIRFFTGSVGLDWVQCGYAFSKLLHARFNGDME